MTAAALAALLGTWAEPGAAFASSFPSGAMAVTITPNAAAPVLGLDFEVELRIIVSGDGPPDFDPPRVLTSVGQVEDPVRIGPREFSARYLLPPQRFPQAAIVVAEFGNPALRGFSVLRLRAAAAPAFHTDPGAQVSLRIGDKDFGPQRAGADGAVRIGVVVPPGVAFGIARSVNRYGKTTEQTVDLKPPPFPRLLLLKPDALPLGSVAEIAVFGVDPSGTPADPATLMLGTSAGKPQPLGGRPGEARFLVRAPHTPTDQALTLSALIRGDAATEVSTTLPLVPGAPARIMLRSDRPRLTIGSDIAAHVFVSAEDLFGNPVHAGNTEIFVDGRLMPVQIAADGRVMASIPAPARFEGRDELEVEAVLDGGYARAQLSLAGLPMPERPARPATPSVAALPRRSLTARAGIAWTLRDDAGPAFACDALFHPRTWPNGLALGASIGYLHGFRIAENPAGITSLTVDQFPIVATGRWYFRPAPRITLAMGLSGGVSLARTRVESYGFVIAGSALGSVFETSGEAAYALRTADVVVGARYLWIPLGRLSSADLVEGGAGGPLVDLGYRMRF